MSGDHATGGDVRALYDGVIAGWNARRGSEMVAGFAEDGVLIGFDGSVHAGGRAAIAAQLDEIFADHETAPFVVKVREVRPLGSDAAVVRAIAGLIPPGSSEVNAQANAHQTLVAERVHGRWQVVLFQNTPAQFHGRPELMAAMTEELEAVRRA